MKKKKAPEILKLVESLIAGCQENFFPLSKGDLALLITAETHSLSLGDPSAKLSILSISSCFFTARVFLYKAMMNENPVTLTTVSGAW